MNAVSHQAVPEVSLCIPTWQSRAFIDRTLAFALGQTHPAIRVLVSVDACDDGTAEACLDIAATEPRLQVFVQSERLGWVRNVNFLLDQVRSELFCLYFHDDVIVPQYVERLVAALRERSDAASVHCDMGHFGGNERVLHGGDYPATAAGRLGWYLVAPNRGAPLRSLTRTSALRAGLRMPVDTVDGMWANEPYLMRLLAIGPALRVPETLYFRWDRRAGGLTEGWRSLPLEQQVAGYLSNVSVLQAIIDAAGVSAAERQALRFCLQVHVLGHIRILERQQGATCSRHAWENHPLLTGLRIPDALPVLGEQIGTWALQHHERLTRPEPQTM